MGITSVGRKSYLHKVVGDSRTGWECWELDGTCRTCPDTPGLPPPDRDEFLQRVTP